MEQNFISILCSVTQGWLAANPMSEQDLRDPFEYNSFASLACVDLASAIFEKAATHAPAPEPAAEDWVPSALPPEPIQAPVQDQQMVVDMAAIERATNEGVPARPR